MNLSDDTPNDPGEADDQVTLLHRSLLDQLVAGGFVRSNQLETAFRKVPRHLFLPGVPLDRVYSDQAVPTKIEDERLISSSSQPGMMAIMLEQLALRPGHHVLEIGTGTGYNAALMAEIVGDQGMVTSIEIDEAIAAQAQEHLSAAGYGHVHVVCGDGSLGYAESAPYDRIILTVGGWDVTPEWVNQLKPDGRLVLPLSIQGPQLSAAFIRDGGSLTSVSLAECSFMRIRGEFAELQATCELGDEPGLALEFYNANPDLDREAIYPWLIGPSRFRSTGVTVTLKEVWGDLGLWQALQQGYRSLLVAQGTMAERGIVPHLYGSDGEKKIRMSMARIGRSGLSVLSPPPGETAALFSQPWQMLQPFVLYVRTFGKGQDSAYRMLDQIKAWDLAGRPGVDGLRIRAFPVKDRRLPKVGEFMVSRRWHNYVLDWLSPR